MAYLQWDQTGERYYEAGVKKVALFILGSNGTYGNGVAWNGVTNISEKPTGAEENALWADDIKYAAPRSAEEFEASIEAFTYPDEFAECDGSVEIAPGVTIGQQARKTFGLAYMTTVGNDTENLDHGYKIHLIYGATASPSEKQHETINENPDAMKFSWDIKTTPVSVSRHKPTSHVVIDSRSVTAYHMAMLTDIIYGSPTSEARLPLPDELIDILTNNGGD